MATRKAPPSKSAVETASAEAAPADADERNAGTDLAIFRLHAGARLGFRPR